MLSRSTPRVHDEPAHAAAHFGINPVVQQLGIKQKFGINKVDKGRSTPWHMLRGNSGFRWFFFGSATSDFGTWLQNSAQVLLAYQLAHSVLTVGLVTFAQFISPLLLGPWANAA